MEMIENTEDHKVSLRQLAKKLDVKAPSLYNYFSSFDELIEEVQVRIFQQITKKVMYSIAGKSGREAFMCAGQSWVKYGLENPALYQWISWENLHLIEEGKLFISAFINIFQQYNFSEEILSDVMRTVRSYVHGFTSLSIQLNSLNNDEDRLSKSFMYGMEIIYSGIISQPLE